MRETDYLIQRIGYNILTIICSSRIQTLMKGLSPAYIRTGVDMSVFSEEPSRIFTKSGLPLPLHVFSCKYSTCGFLLPVHNKDILKIETTNGLFLILASQVDNFVRVARSVKFKILFDLNLQLRYGTQWDPTNTIKLPGYISKMNYQDVFNFELGNGKYLGV